MPEHQLPEQEKNSRAQDSRTNISKDRSIVSNMRHEETEDNLRHLVSGVDIEHINGGMGTDQTVDEGGCGAEKQVEKRGIRKRSKAAALAGFLTEGDACQEPYGNLQDMPQIGVDGQGYHRIVQTAGICKNGDAAEGAVAHQKGKEGLAQPSFFCVRKKEEDIHGHGAELKGKIPPVIAAAVYGKGQIKLFPDLACRHQKTAEQEKRAEADRVSGFIVHRAETSCFCKKLFLV